MRKTELSKSRSRLLNAGMEVIRSQDINDKWYYNEAIGEVFGQLQSQLQSVEETIETGDLNEAEKQAEELVRYGLVLHHKVMIKSDLADIDDDSGRPIVNSLYYSLGSYMEQEDTKRDQWTDETFDELYRHTNHEIDEIRKNLNNNQLDYFLHNATDFALLSLMLLETISQQSQS